MCQICLMPKEKRLEIEQALKENVSVRQIQERFGVGRQIAWKHKSVCMDMAPSDAQTKIKMCAQKLEKQGKWRDAAAVYRDVITVGDGDNQNVFEYLAQLAPRCCESCRKLILAE